MSTALFPDLAVKDDDGRTFHPGYSGRQLEESAIDLEDDAELATPLPHPHLLAISSSSQGMRRRASDINRIRPPNLTGDIELTSLPQPAVLKADLSPTLEFNYGDLARQGANVDVEVAPSLPQSLAPSVMLNDDTNSVAPIITSAQKAAQRRQGRIHYAVLCWNFFLAGWNDGSTGPLLPTFQRFYHVRTHLLRLRLY